jgi:hypothetical protein
LPAASFPTSLVPPAARILPHLPGAARRDLTHIPAAELQVPASFRQQGNITSFRCETHTHIQINVSMYTTV